MLSEALATARTEFYQVKACLEGAQQLYDRLLTKGLLSGPAFDEASLLLSTLRQQKKTAWAIYMREVEADKEARKQQVAQAQQGTFQVSMLISPPAEYARA